MEVVRPADAAAFLDLAGPLLGRDEARNNLILGIAGTLRDHPETYGRSHLWVLVDGTQARAAALQTEPHALVVADPLDRSDLDPLLSEVRNDGARIPGIVANAPHAGEIARWWSAETDVEYELILSQGVYALTGVRAVTHPAGAPRPATTADLDLLLAWLNAFGDEALPTHERDWPRDVDARLRSEDAGYWLWIVDRSPVSLSGFAGPTPTGIRIGPVYTPPEHRRRGYATALVADLSGALLDRGHRACFLYTDLSNPTSNAVYERIGYRRVADAAEYRFVEP